MVVSDRHTRPSQQARSRRSAERLLQATAELLETSTIDELSVSDIAAKAGVAVGTVYSRFRNKDALLEALLDDITAQVGDLADAVLSTGPSSPGPSSADPSSLDPSELARTAVAFWRDNAGVLRSLHARELTSPSYRRLGQANRSAVADRLAAAGVSPGDAHFVVDLVTGVLDRRNADLALPTDEYQTNRLVEQLSSAIAASLQTTTPTRKNS